MKHKTLIGALALAMGAVLAAPVHADDIADMYRGRTITILLG
jgi:hypothetical protein